MLGCLTNNRGISAGESRVVYLSEDRPDQTQGQMPGLRTQSATHQRSCRRLDILNRWQTSWPVQNIGHLFHGFSLASLSHKLRYGLRTIRGSTGGVSLDALASKLIKARAQAAAVSSWCMRVLDWEALSTALYHGGREGEFLRVIMGLVGSAHIGGKVATPAPAGHDRRVETEVYGGV